MEIKSILPDTGEVKNLSGTAVSMKLLLGERR